MERGSRSSMRPCRWLPYEAHDELGIRRNDELARARIARSEPIIQNSEFTIQNSPRPRVLVVDDNVDMRQYIVRLLAKRYDVDAAPDGDAALGAVRAQRPDLIMSDVMMPRLDGFGLLRELRIDPITRTIPVILLSARAGEESHVEGLQHGADDYLIKPFSARELLARVESHVKMAKARTEMTQTLRESEERFRELADDSPLFIWLANEQAEVLYANKSLLRFVGLEDSGQIRPTKCGRP